jgi:DNA-directed RNA polymerase subunit K/omega
MSKVIEDYKDIIANYNPTKNKSKNILSKYEKTKIIGFRMEQLARNAEPYVEVSDKNSFDPYEIAVRELRTLKLPFMICRTLPNGEKEYYRLEDMIIV